MKYNQSYNGKDFSGYLTYLEIIKNKLPQDLYNFVRDVNRHNFEKTSLHDSWLKEFKVKTDFEKRLSIIHLVLLGSYHDREFHLLFEDVEQYTLNQGLRDMSRDLITFEVGIEKNCYNEEQIVFRAYFSMEEEIEIYCNNIKIEEVIKRG
ncbi:hypothetical protein QJU96_08125 [Pasteurella skyensis]|uniref:Uncharacterized protein n=1 Tax=Phocoenobacter skyensis TaxID=97481 RepID=A0AAJ6ND97_9PAST|nr:hypothetical protein [Pasteurella skyensis]MDP8171251.1 hypothetical protein [Pasteurella skyensis]MDP8174699.1 hypothetical protein [Pasteurella skyensis]